MKTFVTIVIILILLRWLLKPIIKFTVNTTINKMASEAMKKQQQYAQRQQKTEGTISVDYIPKKSKSTPKGVNKNSNNDFVDYEEVK